MKTSLYAGGQSVSLKDIAEVIDAKWVGDGDYQVKQLVHPLMAQSPEDLVFAIDPAALAIFQQSAVKTAVITEEMAVPEGLLSGYLVVKRPRYALAALLEIFAKPVHTQPGIHPSAVVESSARLGQHVSVGPFAYIGENAVVGDHTIIMSHVTIGAMASVGQQCLIHPGVRLGERVVIANRVIIHHNASIGADGFSFVTPEAGSIESAKNSGGKIEAQNTEIVRINSVGTVILEDDVEVGACATLDRATLGATIVKKGTKIDNLVMIGHNNTIGKNCLIVSQVGIAGSCTIGDRVVLAGQVGLKDHVKVGHDTIVMAQSGVMHDIPEKTVVGGSPAVPQREFFQNVAYVSRLKKMNQEIQALKNRLQQLETSQLSEQQHPEPQLMS